MKMSEEVYLEKYEEKLIDIIDKMPGPFQVGAEERRGYYQTNLVVVPYNKEENQE